MALCITQITPQPCLNMIPKSHIVWTIRFTCFKGSSRWKNVVDFTWDEESRLKLFDLIVIGTMHNKTRRTEEFLKDTEKVAQRIFATIRRALYRRNFINVSIERKHIAFLDLNPADIHDRIWYPEWKTIPWPEFTISLIGTFHDSQHDKLDTRLDRHFFRVTRTLFQT